MLTRQREREEGWAVSLLGGHTFLGKEKITPGKHACRLTSDCHWYLAWCKSMTLYVPNSEFIKLISLGPGNQMKSEIYLWKIKSKNTKIRTWGTLFSVLCYHMGSIPRRKQNCISVLESLCVTFLTQNLKQYDTLEKELYSESASLRLNAIFLMNNSIELHSDHITILPSLSWVIPTSELFVRVTIIKEHALKNFKIWQKHKVLQLLF